MSKCLLFACLSLGAAALTAAPRSFTEGSGVPATASAFVPMQQPAQPSAPSNPIVRLDASTLRHFDSAVSALAQQARVAIICEGQPLRLQLSEDDVKRVAEQVPSSGMSLDEAVQRVAAAFDYEAVHTGATAFLLTKRYTNPDDLPDITFEEIADSFQNILRAVRTFFPGVSQEDVLLGLMGALSSEQKEQWAHGVPVSTLPPGQRQMAWQLACSVEFRALERVGLVAQRLRGCRSPRALFTKKSFWNLTLPIYEGPFGPKQARWSVALSSWVYTQSGGGTLFEGPPGVEMVGGERIVSKNNQTDPTTPQTGAQMPRPPASSLRHTLGDVVQRINQRLTPGNADLTAVLVDPALSAKTVCMAGEEFLASEALLNAVADVYGLSVRRANGRVRITPPPPRIITNPADLTAEVWRLLPAPFLRAVRDVNPQSVLSGGFSRKRSSAVYVAAVRRLREIIEPEIEKREDHKLPLNEAGDEARGLVALSSLTTCLFDFQSLTRPSPAYITDFDKATVSVSEDKDGNAKVVRYTIQSVNAQGKRTAVSGDVTFPLPSSRRR